MLFLKASVVQRFILRPSLLIWVMLSVIIVACTLCDLYTSRVLSALVPSFAHRRNLESAEWRTSQRLVGALPMGCCVLLETDNDILFNLARYKLYPSRVYRKREIMSGEVPYAEQPDYLVTYMKDSLDIRRVTSW